MNSPNYWKASAIARARRTGYLPVRTSAVGGPEMQRLYAERPAFRVALDQLEHAEPLPWSRPGCGRGRAQDERRILRVARGPLLIGLGITDVAERPPSREVSRPVLALFALAEKHLVRAFTWSAPR